MICLVFRSALDAQQHLRVPEHQDLMVSEDEEQSEVNFLKSLSKKEKKKLLKYVDWFSVLKLVFLYLNFVSFLLLQKIGEA